MIQTINIDFSGGIFNIPDLPTDAVSVIDGTGTLTNDFSIVATGTLYEGRNHQFQVKCSVTKDDNAFNIFGVDISEDNLQREGNIIAVYNGATWDVNIQASARTANWLLGNDITNSEISKTKLTVALQDNTSVRSVVVPISFEASEQGYYSIFPYDLVSQASIKFHSITVAVTKALANTDAGSIVINVGITPVHTFSIPASSAIGYNTTTSNITVSSSAYPNIDLITSKTTAGGKALVTINFEYL